MSPLIAFKKKTKQDLELMMNDKKKRDKYFDKISVIKTQICQKRNDAVKMK